MIATVLNWIFSIVIGVISLSYYVTGRMIKTILYWAFIVVIGIVSVLFLIGLIVGEREMGPQFEGSGPQDAEEKTHAIAAFEMPALAHFIQSALSGTMPGGEKTSLALLNEDGMKCLSKPYKDWAPEPFSNLPGPAMPFGGSGSSPAPMIRFGFIMGGMDSILENAMANVRPEMVGRSDKLMKTKIWFGLAPVSETQWKSKNLDEQDKIEEALTIIEQVIDVWKYLCSPKVQGDIRHVHNKLWAEIDVFQDAINARAAARGEEPEFNLTVLWHEYIKNHFEHMQTQSRSWLYTHLKTLHIVWKDRFIKVMQSGRVISETKATIKIDHYALMVLNKMQGIYMDADVYVRGRTEGFVTADRKIDPRLAELEAPRAKLNAAYAKIFAEMEGKMRGFMIQALGARVKERRRVSPGPDFLEGASLVADREFTHKEFSFEIERPVERQVEGWVRDNMEGKVEEFGFVVYSLCYGESEGAWKETVKKIEEGINSSWEGILDGDKIKHKAKLHWIDGREKMISEGNLDGARKDFQTTKDLESFPKNLSKTVCLAITPTSLSSFKSEIKPPQPLPFDGAMGEEKKTSDAAGGDFGPFLYAIDAFFAPATEALSAPSSTQFTEVPSKFPEGYTGSFPILDQLIWPDLFALHVVGARVPLEEMWALSVQHPWGVYVGPTTGVGRRQWREMLEGMEELLNAGEGCVSS